VICDGLKVSGMVLNDGSCSTFETRSLLNYHALEEFDEWIQQQVKGSGSLMKISSFVLMGMGLVNLFVRF
jgi:hypothetical protein